MKGWFTMCIPFIRLGKHLCIHSVIAAAKLGVICVAWLNENPAMFIIAWIPQIWKRTNYKLRTKKHYEWFEYYLKIKGGDRTRETVERIFIRNLISLLTYTREIAMEYSSKGRVITGIRLDLFQRATYRLERSVLS